MTIAPISLSGFFTNSSGQSIAGGIASGLNVQSVITALTAAQSSQITQLQDKVTINNSQASALSTLQQILTTLQNAASPLVNPNSPDTSNNLWAVRTNQITSNTTQPASNYLTATVASGTSTGTYVISNVSKLAESTIQETGTFASVTASVVTSGAVTGNFTAGTLTIENPNGQTSATVTLNAGDDLTQVAADFNAATSITGIGANVVQTSPGVYTLAFTSTATGAASVFNLGSTSTVTSNESLLGNIGFSTLQTGQDAQFNFNGIPIDRPTNAISDLVSGVTFNLLQDTQSAPGASFTVQIAPDTANIAAGIDAFAAAYNNFVSFYQQQTQLGSNGAPASSSVLFSDTTLRNIFNSLSSEVASIVTGTGTGAPNSLAGVGITLTQPSVSTSTGVTYDILSVDGATLQSELQTNFSGVENVFGYNLTSSSPNLVLFQSSNKQTVQNFNVTIDQTSVPPVYTATYASTTGATITVDFDATPLFIGGVQSGVALTGPAGSALDGLRLLYSGTDNAASISVTTTQGIADLINNGLTSTLQANTGLIATDQQAISASNTTLQTDITNVTTQETNTRTELLQKYSQLEAAINQANSVLNLLNANQVVQSSSSG